MVWRMMKFGLATLCGIVLGAAVCFAQDDELAKLTQKSFELYQAGKYAEALPVMERLAELNRQRFGAESKPYAMSLSVLGSLAIGINRYAEAEERERRAIEILAPDPSSRIELLQAQVTLGTALVYLSKLDEGVALMRGSAEELAATLGPADSRVTTALNNVAQTLQAVGRAAEAEPLYRRLIAGLDGGNRPNYWPLGVLHANLAAVLAETGKPQDAIAELQKSVTFLRLIGNPNHPFLATAINNLAFMEERTGQIPQAESHLREALGMIERSNGRDDPAYGTTLMNLAVMARNQNRTVEAEDLTRQVLTIFERTLGLNHPKTISAINSLSLLVAARGDWESALALSERSTASAIGQAAMRSFGRPGGGSSVYGLDDAGFSDHMRIIYHFAPDDPVRREQGFELFQRSFETRTASALSQMAARASASDGALAQLVRQQQDLGERRTLVDKDLIAALGARDGNKSRPVELRTELQRIDTELARIGRDLTARFPQYAALVNPEPASLADVQRVLKPDEALIGFLDVPGNPSLPAELFGWVVTRERVEWRRLSVSQQQDSWRVPTLRCGLDDDAWERSPEASALCARLTGVKRETGRPLPFNLGRAYELYQELFSPFEDMLKGPDGKWRHLLIVLSGPLSVLPIQTLLTEKPAEDIPAKLEGYRQAKWLGTRQPITMLPSVASLVTLRTYAKQSKATHPFIGFGNPLLVGENGMDKRAWAKLSCQNLGTTAATTVVAQQVAQAISRSLRGGLADVNSLRRVAPLPETADELCAVATSIGADDGAVNLGERATESRVKALSADGTLAGARVVHLATHGLLAGEAQAFARGKGEPSLLLTPPVTATDADDGLLTASEIANLKLDADWVILSACNTAAGEGDGADAFSGLARAFFYAGARSLLVSHWYVDSTATVALVTRIFAEMKSDPDIGRSEALRRAISQLIARGGRYAHPANWAPFVVVGEGAR